MSRIEVDYGELSGLATSLGQFATAGNDARSSLSAVKTAQTGHNGLTDAVGHFVAEWEFSLKKIGENAAAMADKLSKSAEGYRMTDDAIADAATGPAPESP
jgi:uncharacterized protein YukE